MLAHKVHAQNQVDTWSVLRAAGKHHMHQVRELLAELWRERGDLEWGKGGREGKRREGGKGGRGREGGRKGGRKGGREGGKEGGKEGRKGEFQAYTDCNDIYNTLNYLPLEDLVHECIDVASSEGLSQCSHLKDTAPQGPDV